MRLARFKGPLLLLAWQVAPISAGPDSTGKFQLGLGWGGGQFENRSIGCSGEVLSANPVPFNAGGAQLDYRPSGTARFSAFGGFLTQRGGHSGWGGAQAALEGRVVGFGVGIASVQFEDIGGEGITGAVPSAYFRLGSRDRVHFRADMFYPTTAMGTTGDVLRMGVGFNQGMHHGKRGFFGISIGPYADESHLGGFFGEFETPIAPRTDLSLGGSWRPSAQEFDGGARVGLRYHFGR
jgi:hypothetical protein